MGGPFTTYEGYMGALYTNRFECSGCHMFAHGHELYEDVDGDLYHPDCFMLVIAKAEAEKKTSSMHMAGLEEKVPMFAEAQEVA